jgi:hypothetical protein
MFLYIIIRICISYFHKGHLISWKFNIVCREKVFQKFTLECLEVRSFLTVGLILSVAKTVLNTEL